MNEPLHEDGDHGDEPHAPRPVAAPRLLIVDDEPSVVEVFQDFFASQDYVLTVATNGEQAVRALPECRPDIVLTDLNLPGLSGLEVMRAAKSNDPEVCVVVVTGYASASTAIDALRQGAYDYVTKPFDLGDVQQIVERGLANRRLKKLNRELLAELRQKNVILREHEHDLRERVRVATLQMTSLYEVGKEISADLELNPRLALICERAASMSSAPSALVYLRREQGEEFDPTWGYGVPLCGSDSDDARFVSGQGVLGRSVLDQTTVQLITANGDEPITLPGVRGEFRNVLGVPLVAEGQVIGVLCAMDKRGGFTADDQGFLALFASQAAIAIRNSQMYEHMRSLDRLKSEFVAVVSHEIRTPLTSVKGALELLGDDRYFSNNEQQGKLLSIARANAERLLSLINEILDFSKLESASLPMYVEKQSLEPVVAQAIQGMRHQFEEHRLQVAMAFPPELPELVFDALRVTQVITNLLSNALKFSPPGGRIDVFAESWQGGARVGIRDEGEGIEPGDLPRLFRKFSQVDSSATRKAGGTGLGLAICKGIIEQHGGQISVESTPGKGSTFYFTLPKAGAATPRGQGSRVSA